MRGRPMDPAEAASKARLTPCPVRLDQRQVHVALLRLSEEAAVELRHVAIGSDSLAETAMLDVERPGQLAGFPAEMATRVTWGGENVFEAGLVHYSTVSLGVDAKGLLRLGWEKSPRASRKFNNDFSSTTPARPVTDPSKMSGGAFWKYVDAKPGEIWSARRHGKLVGIQVSWDSVGKDEAQAESVESFGEWLRAELAAR